MPLLSSEQSWLVGNSNTTGDLPVALTAEIAVPVAQALLGRLLDSLVILPEEYDELAPAERSELAQIVGTDALLAKLVQRHLLTAFQAEEIRKGETDDLILGHYRLLDVLGQGGMGTVYRAEHIHLRRQVALKVMGRTIEANRRLLHRFYAEARAVARLQHPHIVTCLDAGRAASLRAKAQPRDYFVMELIPGSDLHALISEKGPLSPHRCCDLFRQIAEALSEAHRHGLVHRDIKPGNILITPDWQAKVLDFGLARLPHRNVTEPGTLLGTVGYMAPEQARDPSGVDARADLWSLGATMYWALTAREPYPETGNPIHDLHNRFTTTPIPVRQVRPEVPPEVSDLVTRLMDPDPDRRYPSARTLAAALTGFTLWLPATSAAVDQARPSDRDRVLLIDDDPALRRFMVNLLKARYEVREAPDGEAALSELAQYTPDLVVMDVNLPGLSGADLLDRVRAATPDHDRVKILLISGAVPSEALGGLAVGGADDFLMKPFNPTEFQSRVRSLLLRRPAKVGGGATLATLRIPAGMIHRGVTETPPARPGHAATTVSAESLSFVVSRLLVESGLVNEGHWTRAVQYVRALAAAASSEGEYARLKDPDYSDLLAAVAPIYDIGQLMVPRNVLMKPDRLDMDELSVLQTHTTQGSEVLLAVAGKFAADLPSLPLAAEVVRSHHERWDGTGYPDQLVGAEIPLSARVVAIVAVYEALRSRRPHRPPLSHARAVKIITTESGGQFDPVLLSAFAVATAKFDQIHQGA